jgi:hypothetical protein
VSREPGARFPVSVFCRLSFCFLREIFLLLEALSFVRGLRSSAALSSTSGRFPRVDRSRSRAGIPARFHRWFSFLPLSELVSPLGRSAQLSVLQLLPLLSSRPQCASAPEDFGFARSGLVLLPDCVDAGFSFALKHTAVRSCGGGARPARVRLCLRFPVLLKVQSCSFVFQFLSG